MALKQRRDRSLSTEHTVAQGLVGISQCNSASSAAGMSGSITGSEPRRDMSGGRMRQMIRKVPPCLPRVGHACRCYTGVGPHPPHQMLRSHAEFILAPPTHPPTSKKMEVLLLSIAKQRTRGAPVREDNRYEWLLWPNGHIAIK